MSDSIICGIDGSTDAPAVARVAARLAERLGLRLVVAHVGEPVQLQYAATTPYEGPSGRAALLQDVRMQEESADRLIQEVVAAAALDDVDRCTAVGDPAETLADLADREDAELIVVGSRGRGAFKAAFLGSVSHTLLGIARVPVVIVPRGIADTL